MSKALTILCVLAMVTAVLHAFVAGRAEESDDESDPKPRVVLPDESAYAPSPHDGKGRAAVTPDVVGVREPVTMTIVYTAAGEGIAVGGGVACMVSQFWGWSQPQDVSPQIPGYVTVRCSDEQVKLDTYVDRQNGSVVAIIRERPLEAGTALNFVYGDTSGGRNARARGLTDRYAERGERFFIKVDGDGDGFFTAIREQPTIRVEARQASRLVLFGPSHATVGGAFDLRLSAVDPGNNLVESYEGKAALRALMASADFEAEVTFEESDRGSTRVRVTPKAAGVLWFAAQDADGALEQAQSTPIVVTERGPSQYTLYWADLHGHSNFSDGTALPEDWYRYARDVSRLDVAVLTDHGHWGYTLLDEDKAAWRHILEVSRSYHEPGRFVTFPGYEWTNWQYGHKHVIFADESEAVVITSFDEKTDEPKELWAALAERDCITVDHHPGGGPVPTFWKYYDPHFEPVVEITSVHGVSEAMGHPKCIYNPVESGMVQSALARGYRLGIVGSGDTHDGHPGMRALGGGCGGLAGIYATALTREAVLEALRARRVYATTGCRAVLRFHMGDVHMGGVATLDDPNQERKLSVSVLGDAPVKSVTVVKNNETVGQRTCEGLLESWEWVDPAPACDGDYYYVRIEQADGEWVYSSPIWIALRNM
ncbi:MAG: CehA/McbA family metallohydrolase [Phycisphaerales bacterium]|nr:MAG: CehA/McbA family metallohydrolase [Phycisphaerales bacterium]